MPELVLYIQWWNDVTAAGDLENESINDKAMLRDMGASVSNERFTVKLEIEVQ